MQKLEKKLSNTVQKLLKKIEQQKCSKSSKRNKEIQGKGKRLKLTILKFHSLRGCRRQSLMRNSLTS